MGVRIKGIHEAEMKLDEILKSEWSRMAVAWWDTVDQNVFIPSLEEVPVKSGDLKESGQIELKIEPEKIIIDVGYGSEAINYALVQHEHLEFHHENGKAHYLKDPIDRAIPILPEELVKRLEGRA